MKRSSLNPVGETEIEVLQHVWELGRASVSDVHERLQKQRDLAYTTVMTVMRNLADKGYLTFEKRGNAYVYEPARPAEEVRGSLLRALTEKVFRGSPLALVQTLVRAEDLSPEEREQIRRLIESMEDDNA